MTTPVRKTVEDIKSQLLNPALSSHFQCWFQPPDEVTKWMKTQSSYGFGLPYKGNEEFISIACMDATLPGSSLMTHEQNNDFHGITERHVYRRDYGSGADFTFIVDNNHYIIFFFENWIRYIVNETYEGSADYPDMYNYDNSYSRVNYPNNYKTPYGLTINKFERDYEGSLGIGYQFLNAYPISITSMPVSYESSQLLKCTVSFTYTRYIAQPLSTSSLTQPEALSPLPETVGGTPPQRRREDLDIWALTNRKMIESVGTKSQRDLLKSADSFYSNKNNLNRLRNRASTGGYTAGTNGAYSGRAISPDKITF